MNKPSHNNLTYWRGLMHFKRHLKWVKVEPVSRIIKDIEQRRIDAQIELMLKQVSR